VCVLMISHIDTHPGANVENPFCPPIGFNGSNDEYVELCRTRYSSDVTFRQRMVVIARYGAKPAYEVMAPLHIKGPYTKSAKMIISALEKHVVDYCSPQV